jgi:hypothetical protein
VVSKFCAKRELRLLIDSAAKFLIDKFYWTSPYRWLDEWQNRLEKRAGSKEDRKKIRRLRYLSSECYILGWLGLSILFLMINPLLPTVLVYFLMLRVIGILNKESGVVLFGICKITPRQKVSSPARVIILALVNYLTSGFLFASLYAKVGSYQLDNSAIVSPLPIDYAIVQALSILFTLSPAYDPLDLQTKVLTISESIFCYLFGILIITTFVNLIRLSSSGPKSRKPRIASPARPPHVHSINYERAHDLHLQ